MRWGLLKAAGILLSVLLTPSAVMAAVSVSITPTTVSIQPGGQTQFNAVVSGTSNSVVIWSLSGTRCSGVACGQITSTGLYLAPSVAPNPNVVTVTATALADLSTSASAAVIIGSTSDVSVTVSPATSTVLVGHQQQFVAYVAGTTIASVNWHLVGAACGSSACGSITSAGVYTAPATPPNPAQVTIEATSVADPSKSGSATATVTLPVSVSVSPNPTQVTAGMQKQFTANVLNTTNKAVTWSVTGSGCTGAGCGMISTGGLYAAPATVPNPAQVSVTATSVADPTKSSTATVTITPPVAVTITPKTAQLRTGAKLQFTAMVANTSNTDVTWSVEGSGCLGAACGLVSTSGLYTAPATVPNPAQVSVTATSVADPTKSSTAMVTIIPPVAVTITPKTAQLSTGAELQFSATVSNTTNQSVTWGVSGSGCTGASCGVISTSGLYTAPAKAPSPAQVSITATSVTDPTKSSTATVTIIPPVTVTITPKIAQLLAGATLQFTAMVSNTSNTGVTWTVRGSGCSGAGCGVISAGGLYTAPAAVPTPAQISVIATSVADPTKSSAATVTIIPPVAVTITPTSAQLLTGAKLQFTATVLNASNTAVTWSISGSGCMGAACGAISGNGLYTAPTVTPNPNAITVTATSQADNTKSASAQVTITGPVHVSVSPQSPQVITGSSLQFTATVSGTSNTAVTWSVTGSGCSGSTCGVITSTGLYTAPPTIPNIALVSVTAASVVDPTKFGTALVNIVPPVSITISPTIATVTASSTKQFLASLAGTTNNGVTWSISGSGCSGAACGLITSAGLYTAPAVPPSPSQVTVRVTSAADSTKFATATVTIIPLVTVRISPSTAQVVEGGQQQFIAAVTGLTNTNVIWSIKGSGCALTTCGAISSTGLYTAPAVIPSPSQVTIIATAAADKTKSASATVTIIPPVVVSISPATIQIVRGRNQQFLSKVTGSSNTNVTWSLSGAGCSGSTCGAVNSAGLYTAPSVIPSPAQVSITATSVADASKQASAVATIIQPVTVAIAPQNIVLAVNGQQQFQATVSGSTDTVVTWSIAGNGCSGLACGSISSAGLYTAPATTPSPATITVKATAQIDLSQSAATTITIVANQNSKLRGQYAFRLTGFDSDGVYQAAGSITADGDGNITSGHEDVNRSSGAATDVALTGTYQVTGDNRGALTLTSTLGTQTLDFALNLAGTDARLIEFDSSDIRSSGNFEKQSSTLFTSASLKGVYVMSLTGQDVLGRRIGALANLDLNGAGAVVTGRMDVNDGGDVYPTFVSFQGVYRIDTSGRGLLTLSIPGFAGGAFRFAFYVVSANELLLVSIDPYSVSNPIFSGLAQFQTGGPFQSSSFSGPTVFRLSGEEKGVSQALVGRVSFDGSSQPMVEFDENAGGLVTTGNVLTGAYGVQVDGPGTLNLDDSQGNGRVWQMYAISPNHAFLMDASSTEVGMGELKPQSAAAGFSNSFISGRYVFGPYEPLNAAATLSSGEADFDGVNTVKGNEDTSSTLALLASQSLAGKYNVSSTSRNGRGTLILTAPSGQTIALWITSGSEFMGLEIDPSNAHPVVIQFEH